MATATNAAPLVEGSRPSRSRLPGPAGTVVWTVWLAMSASALWFVGRYGSNMPHLDDWGIIPYLTGNEPVTLRWLWSEHNEHRIPLPRLLLLTVFNAGGKDFRSGM